LLRKQISDLFFDRLAFIDEIIQANLDPPTLTYPMVFDVRDSNRAFENVTEITGLGLFQEKSEADTVSYDKVLQGFSKKFTHVTYAKAVAISMESADDDIDGAITDVMPPLSFSARVSIETLIWNVINNGFTTTTTGDGVALFGTHNLRGGGTFSNNLGAVDLSVSTLESALNKFDAIVDERGLPVEMEAAKIVYPPQLQWLVGEILKSQLRSDTANNAINVLNTVGLQPVKTRYLTDTNAWFLCSEPNRHKVRVYWRMEPMTDHIIDFDTGNLKTKMIYRLSAGAASWRGWVGAQGAP